MRNLVTVSIQRIMIALTLLCVCMPSSADVKIRFVESAPKDWFSLTNTCECFIEELVMTIDLSNTVGKLIFDTTATGEGVEVFQPFEQREGNVSLVTSGGVSDGDNTLSVRIEALAAGQSVSFTIDVDDTLKNSELGNIRVADEEIAGGTVSIVYGDQTEVIGNFDSNAELVLTSPDC